MPKPTRIEVIRNLIEFTNERSPKEDFYQTADKLSVIQEKLINKELIWSLQAITILKKFASHTLECPGSKRNCTCGLQTILDEVEE